MALFKKVCLSIFIIINSCLRFKLICGVYNSICGDNYSTVSVSSLNQIYPIKKRKSWPVDLKYFGGSS